MHESEINYNRLPRQQQPGERGVFKQQVELVDLRVGDKVLVADWMKRKFKFGKVVELGEYNIKFLDSWNRTYWIPRRDVRLADTEPLLGKRRDRVNGNTRTKAR